MFEKDFSQYEKRNYFMYYNHVKICEVHPDYGVVSVDLTQDAMNLRGFVHGGLLFTLADCAAGVTARSLGEEFVTQNASVNFLSNVRSGRLSCRADVIKRGGRVTLLHVVITNEDGKLLLDGTASMFKVEK